jgi:hypothetical protein
MANKSYMNFGDELNDEDNQPYDSLSNRDPLVNVSPSKSDAVKQAIMSRMSQKNVDLSNMSSSDDSSLDEISSDPLMMDFDKNQSSLNDYRQAKVGTDYINNLGAAFSHIAQGTNAPKDPSSLYNNMSKQSQEILQGAESDQARRSKVMEAIEARKSREAMAQDNRNARFEDRKLQRDTLRDNRQMMMDEKQQNKDLALAVPGYERTGEVLPKVEEASTLRKATAQSERLVNNLKQLKDLVNKNGSFEYFGEDAETMRNLSREIQLTMKGPEMYNLGVLSGPDLRLLEQLTSDPSSMSSLFTKKGTRLQQIDNQINAVQSKLAASAKSMGYKPAGSQDEMPKDAPSQKPESNSRAGQLVKVRGKLYKVGADGDSLEEVM